VSFHVTTVATIPEVEAQDDRDEGAGKREQFSEKSHRELRSEANGETPATTSTDA
jgi:hypothetical protein